MIITINNQVRAELDAINARDGRITEEAIVKASRKKSSALHEMFFWNNDRQAAHIGRLEIARALIRKVKVVRTTASARQPTVRVRRYQGLGDGYYDIEDILADRDKQKLLLERALEQLESVCARYSMLRELMPVFRVVKQLRLQVHESRKASA